MVQKLHLTSAENVKVLEGGVEKSKIFCSAKQPKVTERQLGSRTPPFPAPQAKILRYYGGQNYKNTLRYYGGQN